MDINLEDLAKFLVKAKQMGYATNGREVIPDSSGFKEFTFKNGKFDYSDKYAGFYTFVGQEVVRLEKLPKWMMGYSGGMLEEYQGDLELTRNAYSFLKKVLLSVNEERPFRGPIVFEDDDFRYRNEIKGDIKEFRGVENIFKKGTEVYKLSYGGRLLAFK